MNNSVAREKAVYCEAVEITDLEQRRQFLDQACGADKALRVQVEGLLALSEGSRDFFKECAPALEAQPADADRVLSAGEAALGAEAPESKAIGRYKLLQRLGEGGCGVVYMAEQEEPIRRRVALKIIKLGMDTRNVIARFEAERQALALMDHPNIARVLDAGATETGRPYFVMELVYGVKITEYCDQNRVSMRERLELFIQVCNAVQHAHQKGIIHRDLKPSNIMVTMHDGVPVPKVIDFGIAKATEQRLTDKTLFTSYAQLMGTPAYMSPEQMELSGLNLDTRSDIYSLGVLLYELLTGRTPFDTTDLLKLGVDELRRTVCEREPLSPSAILQTLDNEELTKTAVRRHVEPPRLLSQLRGDLDWIVLRCLEKDRTRRYATANGLAMDIERFLNEEPVLARPPSQLYRLQKLILRNRMVCLSGAAAVMALLLGTAISTVMFFREREARTAQALLTREAQLREQASHVALLVTQRRFEEADKLVQGLPLDKPSVEIAAELRALGDWHATKGRWQQAAQRFSSLIKVHQFDDPEVTSVDQLRLAAALLEAGDRPSYEQWRQDLVTTFTSAAASLSPPVIKACLLLPAGSNLLQSLAAVSESDATRNTSAAWIRPEANHAVAWSDTKVLLEYRRGDFADSAHERFLAESAPRLASFSLIQGLSLWHLKDYWGAMKEFTKSYALIQAGARQGLVPLIVQSQIFPGMSEPDYLRAPWYDWAVVDLLLREWDDTVAKDESVNHVPGNVASLEQVAVLRGAAEWHALRGKWNEALRDSQYCLNYNQSDSLDHATMDYVNAAIACLELGDDAAYLRLRGDMPSRFKDPEEWAADRVLQVCLMRPLDDQTAARLEPFSALLERALQKQTGQYDCYHSLILALLEYRHGRYTNALDRARQSTVSVPGVPLPNAMAAAIQAMSLHQLGNHSAAGLELAHAKKLIEAGFDLEFDMWHWRDWIFLRLLLQEARGLIQQAPSPQSNVAPR